MTPHLAHRPRRFAACSQPFSVQPGPKIGAGAGERRTLIYVPIVHTQADMGALAPSVRRMAVRKLGRQAWSRNVDVVGQLWTDIRRTVQGWKLPWAKVRVYQDGLPVCGRETDIVRDLAQAGSHNHQLLLWLTKKGATVMGTESPELLLAEYRLVRLILEAKDPEEATKLTAQHEAQRRSLLVRRDRYIAKRINVSLRPGETGLLFLGMLHSVEQHLDRDILVTYPIHRRPRPERRKT